MWISLLGALLLASLSLETRGQTDPRLRAVGLMTLYGTVGGALLGTASLAFGGKVHSIARGASLGLYAGLLFGGYVATSHYLKRAQERQRRFRSIDDDYYPDSQSIYEERADSLLHLPRDIPLFYMNLVQFNF